MNNRNPISTRHELASFALISESIYYIGRHPRTLEWSSGKVKDSRLVQRGQVTPLKVWVVGALTWNGMLPNAEGNFPPKPRVSVKPLRDADLLLFRKIVEERSSSCTSLFHFVARMRNIHIGISSENGGHV